MLIFYCLVMLAHCKISYVPLIDLLSCASVVAIHLTATHSCLLTFCFNSCWLYEDHQVSLSAAAIWASSSLVPFLVILSGLKFERCWQIVFPAVNLFALLMDRLIWVTDLISSNFQIHYIHKEQLIHRCLLNRSQVSLIGHL